MNPVQNVFCAKCGERIVSLPAATAGTEVSPAIKGLSLPTKSSVEEVEEEDETSADIPGLDEDGPAWLRGLQASLTAQNGGNEVSSSDSEAEVPDWLKDLRASLPEEPEMVPAESDEGEEVPAWLSDLPSQDPEPERVEAAPDSEIEGEPGPGSEEPEAEPVLDAEDSEAPDWLAELRPGEPEMGTEPARGPAPEIEESDIPDWLADLAPAAAAFTAREALEDPEPEMEGEVQPGESEPEPEAETEDSDVPDWLSELKPDVAEDVAEIVPEAEAEPEEATEDEAPDWLSDLAPAAAAGVAAATAAALTSEGEEPEAEEAEAPDWLAELRPGEPELEAELGFGPEVEEAEVPDWLAELRPGEPELEAEPGFEPVPSPETEDSDVPDWLSELEPDAAEDAAGIVPEARAEPEEEAEDEAPDWLSDLAPVAAAGVAAATTAALASEDEEAEAEEAEVPDWLADLQPGEPETEAAPGLEPVPVPEPVVEEPDMPDWLAELQPDVAEDVADVAPEVEAELEMEAEDSAPEWLSDLAPVAVAGVATAAAATLASEDEEPEAEPAVDEAEAPDWLAESPAEEPDLEAEPALESAPEIEEGEVPDWLAELQPDVVEEAAEIAPGAEAEPEEGAEDKAPDWLSDLAPAAAAGVAAAAAAALISEDRAPETEAEAGFEVEDISASEEIAAAEEIAVVEEIAAAEDMPDWLSDLKPEGAPDVPAEAQAEDEGETVPWLALSDIELDDDTLEQATIPDWLLALKPPELRQEEGEDVDAGILAGEGVVEETGLLAGLRGTLPIEMLIAQPRVAMPSSPEPLVTETANSRLFTSIVARPPAPAPEVISRPTSRLIGRLPMLIVYLLLLGAVTLPLVAGGTLLPREIEPIPTVMDLHDQIELLHSSTPVLVAFDYDPSASDEMDMVAQALVDHLMARDARVVAVSLLPAGAPTAQRVLDKVAAEHPDQSYGDTYANLGYIPGQAAAVRLLGQSLETALDADFQGATVADLPALNGIDEVADFALIVELAATQDSVRWWIEQAATPYDVPLAAGTSASVEPLVRPYFETGAEQLQGIVGGVMGTAMYESVRSDPSSLSESIEARLNAQLAGHIVLILTIVVGNVVYLARRGTGRES